MWKLRDHWKKRIDAYSGDLVHCGAGIGRSGMVLVLYLKHHCRISGEEAIIRVREHYDKRAVETQEREELVRNSVFLEN